MADQTLPKISQATRQKLNAYGFTNHAYDYLQAPQCWVPRGTGFNFYTYTVMGLSAIGGIISKKYGFAYRAFYIPFIGAPFAAFYQKKEADFNLASDISKRHPSVTLQNYPVLNKAYKQVSQQIDEQIAKYEQRVRLLQAKVNRGQ